MATIHTLLQQRALFDVTVPLGRQERQKRKFYALPGFVDWLTTNLPNLAPGRLKATESPSEQVDFRLHQWISGGTIIWDRHFKDLNPMADETWELKTVDIRIFGWMYRPKAFIAVFGDYADLYKGSGKSRSYDDAVRRVVAARDRLGLDEPKLTGGTFDELVCI